MKKYIWEKQQQQKFVHFLDGFTKQDLTKIIVYYQLACANRNQKRCLIKSIRESNLNYQSIWRVFIYG